MFTCLLPSCYLDAISVAELLAWRTCSGAGGRKGFIKKGPNDQYTSAVGNAAGLRPVLPR